MATKSATKQLSNTNLMIVLALISLLAVGITAIAAKAMIANVLLNNKVLTAKNEADKNLKTDLDAAPKLVDAYNALGSQAGVLADALPNTQDFPSLIVEMENVTNDSGMSLKTVSPDTSQTTAGVAPVPTTGTAPAGSAPASGSGSGVNVPTPQAYKFELDMQGRYTSLQKLLSDLETSARPMRVTSMQVSGSGSAMSVQLGVSTYYMDKAQLPIGKETVK